MRSAIYTSLSILLLLAGNSGGEGPRIKPLPPAQVRLLDSPFKAAMQRDMAYLLRLEADRLLSGFRREAGLPSKAEIYGGWEAQGVAGHSLGHYLSACAWAWAGAGDPVFLERVNYIVDELASCQQAHGNGYVGAIPEGAALL